MLTVSIYNQYAMIYDVAMKFPEQFYCAI